MLDKFFAGGSGLFQLAEEESKELADAVTRVTQLYDIQIIPEKQMAWVNLGMVGCAIYGPRIMALSRQKKPGKGEVIEMPFTAQPTGDTQPVTM